MTLNDRVINREYIIAKIRQSYTDLLNLYHTLPVEALAEPAFSNGWSIKDTYANVAAWIWRCAAILDVACISDGILLAEPDVRGLKREFYQNCKNWNEREVEQDFRKAHQALLKVIGRIPDDRLTANSVQKTLNQEVYERHARCWTELEAWQNGINQDDLSLSPRSDRGKQSVNYALYYINR